MLSRPDGVNYHVQATAQQTVRRASPEEIIRQLFVLSLLHDYKYPENRIRLEWKIQMGVARKRADIVVLDENGNVSVVVEIKVKIDQHSMPQLKSYMTQESAQYGALISASGREFIQMRPDRRVVSVPDIPLFNVLSPPLANIPSEAAAEGSAPPNDGQLEPAGTVKIGREFPLKQLIGIEKFEWVSNALANITIKGCTLCLPIEEIDSYKTLRKRFKKELIFLTPDVKQAEWFRLFSHLLESNPLPEQPIARSVGAVQILAEYLNEHIGERLVVTALNAQFAVVSQRPNRELSSRYDKDTNMLWISRKHIRTYLEEHHCDYAKTHDELVERGILLDDNRKKVLGAGTDWTGGQTTCWRIRTDHADLVGVV